LGGLAVKRGNDALERGPWRKSLVAVLTGENESAKRKQGLKKKNFFQKEKIRKSNCTRRKGKKFFGMEKKKTLH